jgi:hypothetical protein
VLGQSVPKGDARIVAGKTKLDAQQGAGTGNRRAQFSDSHACATHIVGSDLLFVDDGDAIETEHADRGAE